MMARSGMLPLLLPLVSLVALLAAGSLPTVATAAAADAAITGGMPADGTVHAVLHADGTASYLATGSNSNTPPPGVILPDFDSGGGLVPMWAVEEQQKRTREDRQQAEEARVAAETAAATKAGAEAQAVIAAEAVAAAAAQAAAAEAQRQREADEQKSRQAASAAEELEDEADELLRHSGSSSSDATAEATTEPLKEESQQSPPPPQQPSPEEVQRQQEEADAIAAAAARAYAEQGLVKADSPGQVVHDPAQALFDSLKRAAFFRELAPHNAWQYVQQQRPFVILLLCRCELDAELDIGGLENFIHDAQMHHQFSFLWAVPDTASRFSMPTTYGLQYATPALVIDNIPIGQHVEKMVFGGRLSRTPDSTSNKPLATAKDMFDFLAAFLLAPSPLPLLLRSVPFADGTPPLDSSKRGTVLQLNGDSFEEVVLRSSHSVLVMFYSPTCPGCHAAAPVLDALAETLAWTARDVLVAKMDRTTNDVPMVIRFASYPAILLFRAGAKTYQGDEDSEKPSNRGMHGSRGWSAPINYHADRASDSCQGGLTAQDLEAFVHKHTANLLGESPPSPPPMSYASDHDQPSPPRQPQQEQQEHQEQQEQSTPSTQQQGAAM